MRNGGQTRLFKGNLVVMATPGFIQSAIRRNFIRDPQQAADDSQRVGLQGFSLRGGL
jgi:hypothetical protein